jgi:hypothetical protein
MDRHMDNKLLVMDMDMDMGMHPILLPSITCNSDIIARWRCFRPTLALSMSLQ